MVGILSGNEEDRAVGVPRQASRSNHASEGSDRRTARDPQEQVNARAGGLRDRFVRPSGTDDAV
jgi:hypothetical protein